MIYVASPYTTTDIVLLHSRYHQAFKYCCQLIDQGEICFSPIVYGHQFFVAGQAEVDFRFWRPFNDYMLKTASCIHVLMIDGWDKSAGISHELEMNQSLNLPVLFVEWEMQ